MTPTATDSSPIVISRPETAQLAAIHASLMQEAHDLVVSDEKSHADGLALIKRAKERHKEVVAIFEEPKASAFKAHKFISAAEKAALIAPEAAIKEATEKCNEYEEKARLAAEEEARKQAEEARKAEEDRQLADAEAAEKAGDHAQAEAILDEKPIVPVPHVAPAISKVAGVTNVTRYSAVGDDFAAFVKAVAGVKVLARPDLLNCGQFNQVALNQMATAQRDNFNVPGARIVKTTTKQVRSA